MTNFAVAILSCNNYVQIICVSRKLEYNTKYYTNKGIVTIKVL